MKNIITKTDKRENLRKKEKHKWVKHQYWENWWKSHGNNLSKKLKKILIKDKRKKGKK